jgi:hypothetical protein
LLHETFIRIIHHAVEAIQATGPTVAVVVVHRIGRHSAIWNQLPANLCGYLLRQMPRCPAATTVHTCNAKLTSAEEKRLSEYLQTRRSVARVRHQCRRLLCGERGRSASQRVPRRTKERHRSTALPVQALFRRWPRPALATTSTR